MGKAAGTPRPFEYCDDHVTGASRVSCTPGFLRERFAVRACWW